MPRKPRCVCQYFHQLMCFLFLVCVMLLQICITFCLYFHPLLKIHWPETCIPARSNENSLLWTCRITPSELEKSTKRFNNTGGRLTKISLPCSCHFLYTVGWLHTHSGSITNTIKRGAESVPLQTVLSH